MLYKQKYPILISSFFILQATLDTTSSEPVTIVGVSMKHQKVDDST